MKKIIKFKQEFLESMLNGSGTQTMRMPSSRIDVQENDIVIAVFPNGEELTLKITKVGYKAFKSITDDDAEREGFHNKEELQKCLKDIYSEYRIEDFMRFYYYRFEVISIKNIVLDSS